MRRLTDVAVMTVVHSHLSFSGDALQINRTILFTKRRVKYLHSSTSDLLPALQLVPCAASR